jgi:hypothetical protein
MVAPHPRVGHDGTTTLLTLGYHSAGIDDCWQKCDSGPGGKGFHNADGYPQVRTPLHVHALLCTALHCTAGSALLMHFALALLANARDRRSERAA